MTDATRTPIDSPADHGSAALAVEVLDREVPGAERILTPAALAFVGRLHERFDAERRRLLAVRQERQAALDAGQPLGFPAETAEQRLAEWRVPGAPPDLDDRRVEITGPVERKMMVNALNSGARVFMADFEDALSPTWSNVVDGQRNVADAVRRTLDFTSPVGKEYRLRDETATLLIRPRGWHLSEPHIRIDGEPASASLVDFGLFMFHNAAELLQRGSGPYLYLPKLESRFEARLWNEAFRLAQEELGIPQGSIRATVLIETVTAAMEMDEILFELRDHAAGLNAGRWDYLFSLIKRLGKRGIESPDRAQLTMTVPFMRAYTDLLVRTCHRRGAHAIGGMAAFIPSRRDPRINETAIARVREDKVREAGDGFDGTWVAHPDLVPIAGEEFDRVLGDRPNQKERLREDVSVRAEQLTTVRVPGGRLTEAGYQNNVSVALQYLESWLRGVGAAAINNLMEDAATAEIARSQLWYWRTSEARLADGRVADERLYAATREAELARLAAAGADEDGADGDDGPGARRFADAAEILDRLVLADEFPEFLTLVAYPYLG